METITLPSSPITSRFPRWLGAVLRVLLASVSWALLIAAVLLTALGVGWILLGLVLLGAGPSADADPPPLVVALGLIALTGVFAWLVIRFFASARTVGLVLGSTLVVLFVAGVTWTLSLPDRTLFLARDIVWGPSDVWDYQKFPERVVHNAPPTFQFKQDLRPELFQTMTIEYQQDGQVKQANFEDLLKSTQTTSFTMET